MRQALSRIILLSVALTACRGGSTHKYSGAASVGDFLTIEVDATTKTITYQNLTNGDHATVSYTLRSDGGMDVTDANGDLLQCYELQGVALVCSGNNLGPTGARQPALLYGVLQAPLTKADLTNLNAGYLNFRTREGGIELGYVAYDANGDGTGGGYLPVNLVLPPNWYGKPLYAPLAMPSAEMVDDTAVGTVDWTEPGSNQVSRIFGTAGGDYTADTPGGAVFAFKQAAVSSFDSTNAGTYTALVYNKVVSYAAGLETAQAGTPQITTATVTIDGSGGLVVSPGGSTTLSSSLSPFEGSPWQGPGKVADPVRGLFYFLNSGTTSSYGPSPVFVTFFDQALAFAEFDPIATGDFSVQPQVPAQYAYTYGIAVKAP